MKFRLKKRYFIFVLLLAGFGSLVAYRIEKNKRPASPPGGGRGGGAPLRVDAVVVQPRSFVDSLSAKGSLEANEQVDIRSQVAGVVTQILFREGAAVREGQVLLQIERSELDAQLSQARTREQLARENAERARQLFEREAISREELQTAEAELKSLQAQTRLTEAQLGKTTVRAPFSGTIGLRAVSVGGYLTPETVVARLVDTNPVKLTFSVSEQYANQVRVDTRLGFTVAGDDKRYQARVYAIEPGIDVATRTLQVRALADNPAGTLRPGAFANIQLPLSRVENALLIPSEAVVPVQNGKKVFVAKNGKARETPVETTTRTEREVLVRSGLHPGDTVLTTGILSLKDGVPVQVNLPQTLAQ